LHLGLGKVPALSIRKLFQSVQKSCKKADLDIFLISEYLAGGSKELRKSVDKKGHTLRKAIPLLRIMEDFSDAETAKYFP
jgi:hypothetical protein